MLSALKLILEGYDLPGVPIKIGHYPINVLTEHPFACSFD